MGKGKLGRSKHLSFSLSFLQVSDLDFGHPFVANGREGANQIRFVEMTEILGIDCCKCLVFNGEWKSVTRWCALVAIFQCIFENNPCISTEVDR